MSFTQTEDRAFAAYDAFSNWLARRPAFVRFGF